MSTNQRIKIARNDKCPCNSGKKYKQCCLSKDEALKSKELEKFIRGQDKSSEKIKFITDYLDEEYFDHKVINITDDLNIDNYRLYQIRNYDSKVIMIAEKTESNQTVFASRGPPENDIIIMYRGSYRSFKHDELINVVESIDQMIQTRLQGVEDK
jgi:hypothetical protein